MAEHTTYTMRLLGREISRSSLSDEWRSFSDSEKVIIVSIGILLFLLPILFFFLSTSKRITPDLPKRKPSPALQRETPPFKGKALKFMSNDAQFVSSSSGSIATDQMTVEAEICVPQDTPGQYNLMSLIGDTQDIFASSYTMGTTGAIETSYSMLLNDGSYLTATAPISSTNCHHVAVTAAAQNGVCTMNIFIDGTKTISTTRANMCHLSSLPYKQFMIGSNVHGFNNFQGTIDEVRISDVVRYTDSATSSSSSAPFTPDANTQHLFHLDGDTTDAAIGGLTGIPSNMLPTPTSTVGGIFFVEQVTPTVSTQLQQLTPTVGAAPNRSPTPIPSGITVVSPTAIPTISQQFPPADSNNYILPGPPAASFNQSARFSYSTQSFVSIDDERMDMTSSFTVEAWVRPIAEPPGLYIPSVIISKASPQKLYTMPFSLQLGLYLDQIVPYLSVDANNTRYTLLATNGFLTYNQWHHIAATVNTTGGILRVYVDGNLAGEIYIGKPLVIVDPKIATTIGAMCLDEYNTGQCSRHSLYFNGEIEEVRLSKVVRYLTNFAPPAAPLAADYDTLALYKFDGNTQDVSGRNNHGTADGTIEFTPSTVGVSE